MKKITKQEVIDKRLSQVLSNLRLSGLRVSEVVLDFLRQKINKENK